MSDWPEVQYRYPLVGRAVIDGDGVRVDLIDKQAQREVQDNEAVFVQRPDERAGGPPEPPPPDWEANRIGTQWAVCEIMGHRVRAGSISDAEIGGATLLRIEHPTVADHDAQGPLTEFYGQGSVFALRPCSRETAVEYGRYWGAQPVVQAALPAADGDDWWDPEEEPI